jgi:Flp pilus assembly protein TadG
MMGNMKSKRRHGTTMLEMAVSLPLLLTLSLGTVEFGVLFSRYQILLASAREGGRTASLYRMQCNPRRVKGEVDVAVMNNSNQLGMLLLPSNVSVKGACIDGNVTVIVRYIHYFSVIGSLLTADANVPLEVTVVMRNEIS